jgi:general secretion pathway protein A
VLIIDEAQHLSSEVLEEIRVLSNLETNDQKLLQVVIVGQLNLIEMLHKPDLRQLDQRISIRCYLKPLTREEVEAYVTHRLWVARGSTPVTFTPRAFDLVHSISGGIPRIINLICDRALMAACETQTSRINEEHVVAARRSWARDSERQDQGREAGAPVASAAKRSASRAAVIARGAVRARIAARSGSSAIPMAHERRPPPSRPTARAAAGGAERCRAGDMPVPR